MKATVAKKYGADVYAKPNAGARWIWKFDFGTEIEVDRVNGEYAHVPLSGWVKLADLNILELEE